MRLVAKKKRQLALQKDYESRFSKGSFYRKNLRKYLNLKVKVKGKVVNIYGRQVTLEEVQVKDEVVDHINIFLENSEQLEIAKQALIQKKYITFKAIVSPYFSKGRVTFGLEEVRDLIISRKPDIFTQEIQYLSEKTFVGDKVKTKFVDNDNLVNLLAQELDYTIDDVTLANGITFLLKKELGVLNKLEEDILQFLPRIYQEEQYHLELLSGLEALRNTYKKTTYYVDLYSHKFIKKNNHLRNLIQSILTQLSAFINIWKENDTTHIVKYSVEGKFQVATPILLQKGDKREFLIILPYTSSRRESDLLRKDGIKWLFEQMKLHSGDRVTFYNPILNRRCILLVK